MKLKSFYLTVPFYALISLSGCDSPKPQSEKDVYAGPAANNAEIISQPVEVWEPDFMMQIAGLLKKYGFIPDTERLQLSPYYLLFLNPDSVFFANDIPFYKIPLGSEPAYNYFKKMAAMQEDSFKAYFPDKTFEPFMWNKALEGIDQITGYFFTDTADHQYHTSGIIEEWEFANEEDARISETTIVEHHWEMFELAMIKTYVHFNHLYILNTLAYWDELRMRRIWEEIKIL